MKRGAQRMRIGVIPNCDPSGLGDIKALECENPRRLSVLFGGNSGNLAYVNGLLRLINGNSAVFSWSEDVEWVQDNVDLILVCCANQLGSHADLSLWAERLKLFQKPVCLIGLGAQSQSFNEIPSVPQGTLEFLRVVEDLSPGRWDNIATRGLYSTKVLKSLGCSSVPSGCPSILISTAESITSKLKSRLDLTTLRVAIAAGNPWVDNSAGLEQMLVSFLSSSNRGYIVQHPDQLLALAMGKMGYVSEDDLVVIASWLQPLSDISFLDDWFKRHSSLFLTVDQWLQGIESFDFVIGTRFHGVCLGIQAGLMGTVITIDSRTQELCETTGIKSLSLKVAAALNRDELLKRTRWSVKDLEHFLARHKRVAHEFSRFFYENGIEPSVHALAIEGWR